MKTQWMVETRGDPLGAVRGFLRTLWMSAELDGMIVPAIGKRPGQTLPDILICPGELDQFNPFRPLMGANAAKYLPDLLRQHSERHFGVVLRPCEMRALIEMVKRDSLALERLLTICIDCPGTYPAEEYEWRASRKGSSQILTREGLHFAHMGGIVAYRYRSACQMCTSPRASGAHLNLGVLGLPVRQHLLIQARDSITAEWLQLDQLADREADPELTEQHERTVAKMVERNSRTRERITQGIADVLPRDVGGLIEQFEACGACQECLNNCPICAVDTPRQGPDGKHLREDITRWMLSCAGCGMCEQACPHHLPLCAIFHYIKQQLALSYGYTPGLSVSEPLPPMERGQKFLLVEVIQCTPEMKNRKGTRKAQGSAKRSITRCLCRDAERWDARYAEEGEEWLERSPRPLLLDYAHVLPSSGLALDAASGVANNGAYLARLGLRVIALDISENGLRLAMRRAREEGLDLSAAVYDLSAPWLPADHFDVIVNFRFLERATFPVYRQALKNGGWLFFETFLKTAGDSDRPEYYLNAGELKQAFRDFEILHWKETKIPGTDRATAQLVARKPL